MRNRRRAFVYSTAGRLLPTEGHELARRSQWFDEHPAACTCVACNEGGARRRTPKRPGRKVPQGSRRREGEHPPTSDHPPACTCVACFKNLERDLRSSERALGDVEARSSRGGGQPPVLRTRRGSRRPPGKRKGNPDRGRASRHGRDRSGCRLWQRPERSLPGRRVHRQARSVRGHRYRDGPWTSRGACRRQSRRRERCPAPRRTFGLRLRRQSPRPWRPCVERPLARQSRSPSPRRRRGRRPVFPRPALRYRRPPLPRPRRLSRLPRQLRHPFPLQRLPVSLREFTKRAIGWSKKTRGWLPRSRNWGGYETASTVRSPRRFRDLLYIAVTSRSVVSSIALDWTGYRTVSAPTRPKRLTGSTTCQVLRSCRPS